MEKTEVAAIKTSYAYNGKEYPCDRKMGESISSDNPETLIVLDFTENFVDKSKFHILFYTPNQDLRFKCVSNLNHMKKEKLGTSILEAAKEVSIKSVLHIKELGFMAPTQIIEYKI